MSGRFSVGDEVRIEVDAARRMLHARLHSAGHLLDSAFINMGMTDLVPAKVLTKWISSNTPGGYHLKHR